MDTDHRALQTICSIYTYCYMTITDVMLSYILVYDGRGTLDEGETAEARFIKIQAAYELLIDEEKRSQYDKDNRVNPMKVILGFRSNS